MFNELDNYIWMVLNQRDNGEITEEQMHYMFGSQGITDEEVSRIQNIRFLFGGAKYFLYALFVFLIIWVVNSCHKF